MAFGFKGGFRMEQSIPKELPIIEVTPGDCLLLTLPSGFKFVASKGNFVSYDTVVAVDSSGSQMLAGIGGIVMAVNEEQLEIMPTHMPEKEYQPIVNSLADLSAKEIVNYIRLGGLICENGIPLWKMLAPLIECGERLIVNAVETEPGVTSVRAMLRAYPKKVIGGIKILLRVLSLGKAIVTVSDGMRRETDYLRGALNQKGMVRFYSVPNKYPLEDPRFLYPSLTGVYNAPSQNKSIIVSVSDCIGVYELFVDGKVTLGRVITVDGNNYRVHPGTPIHSLAELCGITPAEHSVPHIGGLINAKPAHKTASITYSTRAVQHLVPYSPKEKACIQCGRCCNCCPVQLMPMRLIEAIRKNQTERIEKGMPEACIDCGLCDAVCPSEIGIRDILQNYIRSRNNTEKAHEEV